jgi:hypothetical protein
MLTMSEWKLSNRKIRVDLDHKLFLGVRGQGVVGMSILNEWPVLNQQKSVGAFTQS